MKSRLKIKVSIFFTTIILTMVSSFTVANAGIFIQPAPTVGLAAYWSFDTNAVDWNANTLSDKSGNGNTGTLVFMDLETNRSSGKLEKAIFFDGNANSISLATNPLVSVADPSSVCAWVNNNNISSSPGGWNQTFLNIVTNSSNGIRMGSIVNTGNFYTSYRIGGVFYGVESIGQVFPNNRWVHVCYVWNGSNVLLYAGGVLLSTAVHTNSIGLVNTIGARDDEGNGAWSGIIDDLRIYSRALSITEIQAIYKSGALVLNSLKNGASVTIATTKSNYMTDGLVGHWSFDGSKMNWATNRAIDGSGNGNNGLLTNMSTTTSPAQGKIGQALKFDGVNDYISFGAIGLMDAEPFSVSAWFYTDNPSSGATKVIVSSSDSAGLADATSDAQYITVGSAGQIGVFSQRSTYGAGATGPIVSSGRWYHVVGVYENIASRYLYLDGVLISHNTDQESVNPPNNFRIGSRKYDGGETGFFDGAIDDVRIYNRVLSTTEIRKLYELGR